MSGRWKWGSIADLVLWEPAFFGVKPNTIVKGGMIAAALMGDPNASIPTPEPVRYRPMFGAMGKAMDELCFSFVSQAALDGKTLPERLGRTALAVRKTRSLRKADMILNDAQPQVDVDPENYEVRVDGESDQERAGPRNCLWPSVTFYVLGSSDWGSPADLR